MNTETTQARVSGTLDPIVGRYGHCMDCDNWTPLKKSRDRATYGQCSEYDERTSFDSSCNRRFVQANKRI